jgi:two-component system, chemotaxis family, chemotaxis protein CheY
LADKIDSSDSSKMGLNAKQAEFLIQQLTLLVVDDNPFMRTLVRDMLANIGVKNIYEAGDGVAALEMIRVINPDVVVLDLEMPLLNGAELLRIVRSPGAFPNPDVPIIVLTSHGERSRVLEAAKLGANELLCKPVSAKVLYERLLSILLRRRSSSVNLDDYDRPAPRRPTPPVTPGRSPADAD